MKSQDDDLQWEEIFSSQPGAPEDHSPVSGAPSSGPSEQVPAAAHAAPRSRREARVADSGGERRRSRADGGADPDPETALPPRRRRWGWLIALLVILGLGAGSVAFVWLNFEDQIRSVMGWEIPPEDFSGEGTGEATVIISPGDTGEDIAHTLVEAGVVKSFEAFYELLVAENPSFFPGYYVLAQEMSSRAALDALLDPANKMENSALIQEGWSVDQAIDALSAGTGIAVEEFEAAVADPSAYGVGPEAPSIEGYLFPARYTFDPSVDAVGVITTLVNRTFQSLDAAGVAPADRHRVLTIAALIQREAGSNPDDFYKVSRVIQNRLDEGMKLEFDSTSHYGWAWAHGERQEGGVFSTADELSDDNPFNTYVHTGLPPGPISAAGDLAITAALSPVDGPWLFFVAVNLDTGETKFTETVGQHEAAVNELRAWCRETKSPNCE